MRQEYPLSFLNTIAQTYDVGPIKAHKLFTSGYENSNYYIQTPKGEFVIKIFEGEGINKEIIFFEAQVMDTSNKAGVLSPHIYPNNNNKLCTIINDKCIILMNYMTGENMDWKVLSDTIVFECGQEMAKMQNALSIFHDPQYTRQGYEFDQKNLLQLEPNIDIIDPSFDKHVFRQVIEEYYNRKTAFDQLPQGIIHNDMLGHNILAKDGKLTGILDFSDMTFSPYVQDISVFMGQSIFGQNYQPHQSKVFLEGYSKYKNLSSEEIAFLPFCIKQRLACVVLAFSRWERDYGSDPQRKKFIEETYKYLIRFVHNHEKDFFTIIA